VLLDTRTEQRWSARKIFKAKAVLSMEGATPAGARTLDIGGNGMSLALPYPLTIGNKGLIQFDLLVDGKAKPVKATGAVTYCIFSNDEFKVGFKFMNLDLLVLTAITKFVGQ
jgi:hypothetical protein